MQESSANGLSLIHQETAPLRARIIEEMRSAIERGKLRPGERLVEKALCEQMGVSRTSLREALRELEAVGVVAPRAGRGLTVAAISHQEAKNIYLIRADIEALVVAQFCEAADDAAMETFNQICTDLVKTYEAGEFGDIIESKKRLHRHLCEVAQNSVALDILLRLTLRTAQLRSRSVSRKARQEQSIAEIEDLRRSVLDRDVTAAREAALRHVRNAARSALEGL